MPAAAAAAAAAAVSRQKSHGTAAARRRNTFIRHVQCHDRPTNDIAPDVKERGERGAVRRVCCACNDARRRRQSRCARAVTPFKPGQTPDTALEFRLINSATLRMMTMRRTSLSSCRTSARPRQALQARILTVAQFFLLIPAVWKHLYRI